MCPRQKGEGFMTVGQVMRRVRELDIVIETLEKPDGEIFPADIAEYLKDYQRMLLAAEVKL